MFDQKYVQALTGEDRLSLTFSKTKKRQLTFLILLPPPCLAVPALPGDANFSLMFFNISKKWTIEIYVKQRINNQ